MAPIDINNQEISSITLNGNEINTVDVNGQEVFSSSAGLGNLGGQRLYISYYFDEGDENQELILNTPWNINSFSDNRFNFRNAQRGGSCSMSHDGEHYYYAYNNDSSARMVHFELSTPYELQSATATSEINSRNSRLGGHDVSFDGQFFYHGVYNTSTVERYSLSTPYEYSSIPSSPDQTVSLNGVSVIDGFCMIRDGSKIVASDRGSALRLYSLSTPFDITTASLSSSFTGVGDNTGVVMSDDGTRIAWVEYGDSDAHTADISTPYDLSTISNINKYNTYEQPWGISAKRD